jgi:hypothetical protein
MLGQNLLSYKVTPIVPKVRRGGYVFLAWTGDHSPRHVHVYRDGVFVLKWDLENDRPMAGRPNAGLVRLIAQLRLEGLL